MDIRVLMLTQDFVFPRIRVTFAWFLDMLHTAILLEYFNTLITLISANFKISVISRIRVISVSPAGPRDHLPLKQGLRQTTVVKHILIQPVRDHLPL